MRSELDLLPAGCPLPGCSSPAAAGNPQVNRSYLERRWLGLASSGSFVLIDTRNDLLNCLSN